MTVEETRALADVAAERDVQDRWGVRDLPDGTSTGFVRDAEVAEQGCVDARATGDLTWRHLMAEAFFGALAGSDVDRLRAGLVRTAAVAVQWVQALDRRAGAAPAWSGRTGVAEKLVRDRIPEIISSSGRVPETRVADGDEYASFLRAKLHEEVGEYAASGDPAELADVLEVVHALADLHGMAPDALERLRAGKAEARGGFGRRLILRLPF